MKQTSSFAGGSRTTEKGKQMKENNGPIEAMPEGRIRALVMDAYCQVAGNEGYRHQITAETEVEKIHVPNIIRKMSERMGFEIPSRKVPRYGWRISTIVGHIAGCQKALQEKNSQITPS